MKTGGRARAGAHGRGLGWSLTVRGGRGPWKASCASRVFSRDTPRRPRCSRPLGTRRPFSALRNRDDADLVRLRTCPPPDSLRPHGPLTPLHQYIAPSGYISMKTGQSDWMLQRRPSAALLVVSQPRTVRDQRGTAAELRGCRPRASAAAGLEMRITMHRDIHWWVQCLWPSSHESGTDPVCDLARP